ncbi:MAG: 30S ribosomal protein S9 [Patescibacteria group bacterium]|nr:30S ribosomal protein S9 [Patescibacteria group bacterium]
MVRTKKTEEVSEKETDLSKKRVRHSYLYAVGRRKTSVARVRLFKKGEGKITVNEKNVDEYFPTLELREIVRQPLVVVGKIKEFDITIKTTGGGSHGQAEACRHGISRVLQLFDKDLRKTLKPHGYLKRDPRRKERKKPGLKRARRAPQWAKR